MKRRNTNVATMVLWQGKDGEPGLDVSNTCIKHLPITIDAPSSITARILLFSVHSYAYNIYCYTCRQCEIHH